MLKIHDLYGQSFAHEFQFSNPDSIKNAVKRYNLQRAAERDEYKRDKETHKFNKLRFCKMRNNGNDVLGMVTSRDLDVETQMSLDLKEDSSSCGDSYESYESCIFNTSDQESELGIDSVCDFPPLPMQRLAGGADTCENTCDKTTRPKALRVRKQRRGIAKPKLVNPKATLEEAYTAHIEGLHREICAELQQIAPTELRGKRRKQQQQFQAQPQQQQQQQQHRQRKKQLPKMQQPYATIPKQLLTEQLEQEKIMQRLKQVLSIDEKLISRQVSYAEFQSAQQPDSCQSQWMDIIPSPMLPQLMNADLCRALNTTPSMVYMFMKQHGLPCEPLEAQAGGEGEAAAAAAAAATAATAAASATQAVDSDLEQEIVDRPGYMRYIERLPYNPSEPLENPAHTTQPCFVELEPHPQWLRLQRSLKPMAYTSQRSDTDTVTLCDAPMLEEVQPVKSKTTKAATNGAKRPRGKQNSALATTAKRRPLKRKEESTKVGAQQTTARQSAGKEKPITSVLPPGTGMPAMPATPNTNTNINLPKRRGQKARNVICTRSLENLKYQKMAIYNRISLTQERIITALDRLQGKLLQLQMPTCSNQEKQRRERKAFEFCVKFSRNFLYPLRGLIESVRCTPVANFNSANSNEASQRVVCVYSLMHHSIGSYRRQLRYFLLDKVPQKLSALIEMMYTLTNICLEKGVLDRQDPVVECLQQRCTSFLTFIEDMQEERFQLARETYRRMQKRRIHHHHGHGHGHGAGRTGAYRERYDLKMFLNDLKLYEPRLVPKERVDKRGAQRARQRSWIRRSKREGISSNALNQSHAGGAGGGACGGACGGCVAYNAHESNVEKTNVDPEIEVPTHIECVQCGDYRYEQSSEYYEHSSDQKDQLSNILALLQHPCREKRELHQQLLEAMEHVTKSQVREVLDPLVRSLGAIIDKKTVHHQTP